MDGTEKPIVRGHVLRFVLGLCLIIAACMRPEIGLHVPGYLADLFLGPVNYGATGLTWALTLLAGIGLLGALRWAGFFAALALVYNLIPGGSELSFLPFVPTLVSALGIGRIAGLIIVHAANLVFVGVVLGVEIATTKRRSGNAAKPTMFHLAIILALGLLSGVAVALPIGCTVALILDQSPLGMDVNSSDAFSRLFLLGGILLIGGGFGLIACWQRLLWIARARRSGQETGRGNAAAASLLSGVAAAVPACLLTVVAVAVPPFFVSQRRLSGINPFPKPIDPGDFLAWLVLLGGVFLIGALLGVVASWRRLIRIVRFREEGQANDGTMDSGRLPESAAGSTERRSQFSLRALLLGLVAAGAVATFSVAAWQDAGDPLRYDRHLHGRIAWGDRIVVRKGGFDCCHPVDGQQVLFAVVDPDELSEVRDHLHVVSGRPSWSCLCCGFPGIDWYRGETRIALTTVQHGFALRWAGFPRDAYFTRESALWLRQWLERHGFSEEKLNSLQQLRD